MRPEGVPKFEASVWKTAWTQEFECQMAKNVRSMLKKSIRKLSGSISSNFGESHSWNVRRSWKLQKKIQTTYIGVQGHSR